MSTADAVIAAARACLGTPFRHQGRVPGLALDCAGLVIAVARAIGAEHVDVPAYGRHPSGGLLEASLGMQPCLDRVSDRQPGDILLMRFDGDPQHLAIFTGETIIHSYLAVGRVCEHGLDDAWTARIVAAWRFRGVV